MFSNSSHPAANAGNIQVQRTCLPEALFMSIWIVLLQERAKFCQDITSRILVTSTYEDAKAPPWAPCCSSCVRCPGSCGLCTWQWELHASTRFNLTMEMFHLPSNGTAKEHVLWDFNVLCCFCTACFTQCKGFCPAVPGCFSLQMQNRLQNYNQI